MKARIITVKGKTLSGQSYLALDIEGMIFRLTDTEYVRLNKGEGVNGDLVAKFARIVAELEAVEERGGIKGLLDREKGYCSYRQLEQCTQG